MVREEILEVEESPVKFGGRARVNKNILEKLGLREGVSVVVSSDKKDILTTLYSDTLIEEGKIKVRGEDRKKLQVKEKDKVKVKEHQGILNKLL